MKISGILFIVGFSASLIEFLLTFDITNIALCLMWINFIILNKHIEIMGEKNA